MKAARIQYRLGQFWSALFAAPQAADLQEVSKLLNPAQMTLFNQMQPSEQAHCIQVMRAVRAAASDLPPERKDDLMAAALLHDVGKSLHRLAVWERVVIVLTRAFFPRRIAQWGAGEPAGWRRAFVIAEQHSAWGAQMAAQADAAPLVVDLIRHHQDKPGSVDGEWQDDLLHRLQAADHEL